MTVAMPEPFRAALEAGRPADVAGAPAATPEALFARAQARMQVGRDEEARADLKAALPALGDPCRIELAWLDLRERRDAEGACAACREVLERAPQGSALEARACHILGLAEGRRRKSAAALDRLLHAADLYARLRDRRQLAQVYDTLGSLFAAQGRLDHALSYYALSIVEKSIAGDRYGTALTLGNLGRVHLRAGRPGDAVRCFELDLELATALGDTRGRARMHEDLGRTRLAMEDAAGAEAELRRCLEIAAVEGYRDLAFFARVDLARALLALDRSAEAKGELDQAEALLADGAEVYLQGLLRAAQGEWQLRAGSSDAIATLEQAARHFEQADAPDLEIPTLLTLARALVGQRLKATAEARLRRALLRAQNDGYARYLPALREAMERLELVEGVLEETGRLAAESDSRPLVDGYRLLEVLGRGGYGTVHRAFDPDRGRMVVIKRLDVERLYPPLERAKLLLSARVELEAATRVRHPGIARVHAIGRDARGGAYVVQEFVEGRLLSRCLPTGATADPREALEVAGPIAWALDALHAAGIVHRDLKPENVILRAGDGSPVLIDFGIARVPALEHGFERGPTGPLHYMAPEQARGRPVDGRADVYALGVLLYRWLTGEFPLEFESRTIEAWVKELQTKRPRPLGRLRSDLDPELVRLVHRMLEKKPAARPGAGDVAEACGRL
jgi:tetratricopeptide (TPR) repeat protein